MKAAALLVSKDLSSIGESHAEGERAITPPRIHASASRTSSTLPMSYQE